MREPKKWRDLVINPFELKSKNFEVIKVLGFPHAKNDVFYVKGLYREKECLAYIKCARTSDVDFLKEAKLLQNYNIPNKPKLIDFDKCGKYIITKAARGKRLSKLLVENETLDVLVCMEKFGKKLAQIHKLDIMNFEVDDRKFFHIPSMEYCDKYGLNKYREYLITNAPKQITTCFCHGDMHYANVLWYKGEISAILDYELSGLGNKEFDIAWSVARRPSQKFMKTDAEFDAFINGYKSENDCNINSVKYYMALIYLHFYKIGFEDKEYIDFIREWLEKNCKNFK